MTPDTCPDCGGALWRYGRGATRVAVSPEDGGCDCPRCEHGRAQPWCEDCESNRECAPMYAGASDGGV